MDQFNKYIDSINDPADLEKIYISTVSFVPTNSEIDVLLSQSKSAIKTAENKIVSNVLSKVAKLIPESFNPNDTVLNTAGMRAAKSTNQLVELKEGLNC